MRILLTGDKEYIAAVLVPKRAATNASRTSRNCSAADSSVPSCVGAKRQRYEKLQHARIWN